MNREKIIYSVLKEIEKGNYPREDDYGLTKEDFGEIIELMLEKNLIKNASVVRSGQGNKVRIVFLEGSRITFDGINYLKENSTWNKTYETLKEIKDWIK